MTPEQIDLLRDALEGMCWQYLHDDGGGCYSHDFMSAGEDACDVLTTLFPDRWEQTPTGARFKGEPWGDA